MTTEQFVGCDVIAILKNMMEDQHDYNQKHMNPSYLKYRRVVAEWILDLGEHFHLHITTSHAAITVRLACSLSIYLSCVYFSLSYFPVVFHHAVHGPNSTQ